MVSTRTTVSGRQQRKPRMYRARVFSTLETRPYTTEILTYNDSLHHFPAVEAVFEGASTQAYIHDCQVVVFEGSRRHIFHIFFKNHINLPKNFSVRSHPWRGDIVVMRCASRGSQPYVHVRPNDAALIDYAVHRFVATMKQKTPITQQAMTFRRRCRK